MIDIILLVSAIAVLQAGGAYVRYMPFAGIMDDKTKRRLLIVNCFVLLFNMSWMRQFTPKRRRFVLSSMMPAKGR